MTRAATTKLGAYAGLAAFGLIAALVLGRPEPAALAAPFALLLVVGLSLAEPPKVSAFFELDAERQVEGEPVEALLELRAENTIPQLELLLDLPHGLAAEAPNPRLLRLYNGDQPELSYPLRCERWGAYLVGDFFLRTQDRFGLLVFEQKLELPRPLKVYPRGEELDRLLRPLETQSFAGSQTPRVRGEGIEFADLRPFVPGDRVRRVNWRATARRGEPWVNETHPERNTDVVIFLDTFAEARDGASGTLDLAVEAAGSLAAHYIQEKDRVGLVGFGGVLNWLTVSSGIVQLYRVLDSLLDAEIFLSYAWKDIDILPVRDAAAARARARADAAARRPLGARADRPARPRLRPGRGRDLAGAVRRAGNRRARRSRLPALAAAARGAAGLVPAARRAGRGVEAGHPAAGRARGGEDIQAPRPGRARLATGATAVLVAAGLVAVTALRRERPRLAAAVGRRHRARPAAARPRAALEPWPRARRRDRRRAAGGCASRSARRSSIRGRRAAAGLLLFVAELAWWSIEPRVPAWAETALAPLRLVRVLAVCAAGALLAALVLVVASSQFTGGVELELAGVLAAISALAVVALGGANARPVDFPPWPWCYRRSATSGA